VVNQRGNMVETMQLEQVVPGESSRSDVLKIMGSPTTIAPFDDNTWYYIGQETAKHGILDPEVVEERIVVVTFAEDGLVDIVRENADGRVDVPIAADKTPTHGNDITFMQQFLGNLGRFNPQEQ
jgi:outer membrane protein assembly factor BamE (lipoprotein component of BamABCDE complex)